VRGGLPGALRWTAAGGLRLRPARGGPEDPIEALIFDLGGTLDSDGRSWAERFRRLLGEEKLPGAEPERIEAALAAGERALLRHPRAARLGLGEMVEVQVRGQLERLGAAEPARVAALAARFAGETAEALRRRRGLLARLALRLPLALVSNGCGNTRRLLAEHGLERSFRQVVDSSELGCWKPDPRIFEPAIAALAVKRQRIAVVGDRLDRDVAGARGAGLRALWVAGERGVAPGRSAPLEVDVTLSSVDQLDPEAA
jgi:putative hydrolase of the HAD superfamily